MPRASAAPVLVTGATGFVGRHLVPALAARGVAVRATTRRAPASPLDGLGPTPPRPPPRAARGEGGGSDGGAPGPVRWVEADLARAADLSRALDGVSTAYFLVHGMASGREDYAEEERRAAAAFAREAERAGVERIVYLGGVAPRGRPSKHLASRLAVGEVLRSGRVPALELRASMIVGAGSASWRVVRDLALRLPAMVLPAWASSRTCPVAIDDVVDALVLSRELPLRPAALPGGAFLDLPGPEVLSLREILERVAALRGRWLPSLRAPLPAPRVSTLWLKLVSDADWRVVRELVLGLEHDLLPQDGASFWERVAHGPLVPFDEAARRALAAEPPPAGLRGALRAIGEAVVQTVGPRLGGSAASPGPGARLPGLVPPRGR